MATKPPVAERPPQALYDHATAGEKEWLELWKLALRRLKDDGTWKPELRTSLEAFVAYRRLAKVHREAAEADSFSVSENGGRVYAHPGFNLARDAEREARALAELLLLTPEARRRAGLDEGNGDGPDAFDDI